MTGGAIAGLAAAVLGGTTTVLFLAQWRGRFPRHGDPDAITQRLYLLMPIGLIFLVVGLTSMLTSLGVPFADRVLMPVLTLAFVVGLLSLGVFIASPQRIRPAWQRRQLDAIASRRAGPADPDPLSCPQHQAHHLRTATGDHRPDPRLAPSTFRRHRPPTKGTTRRFGRGDPGPVARGELQTGERPPARLDGLSSEQLLPASWGEVPRGERPPIEMQQHRRDQHRAQQHDEPHPEEHRTDPSDGPDQQQRVARAGDQQQHHRHTEHDQRRGDADRRTAP